MAGANMMPMPMLGITWRGSSRRTPEPLSYFQPHGLNQILADESPLATPGSELWT